MQLKYTTQSTKETTLLALSIGARLKGSECIELISDVGGGKTTFVKGLAKGAGSKDVVSSPTFTISKVYRTSKFDIVHFDFYRLNEAGLIEHEIEEAVHNKDSVIVVEWSDIVNHVLPKDRLRIRITAEKKDNSRTFIFDCSDLLDYLLKGIV